MDKVDAVEGAQKRLRDQDDSEDDRPRKRLATNESSDIMQTTADSNSNDNIAVDNEEESGEGQAHSQPIGSNSPETIIDFCRRKGYIPQGTEVPTQRPLLQPFLTLNPLRDLTINPMGKAFQLWQANTRSNRWYALFTYVGGKVASEPCKQCAKGTARWTECVVPSNKYVQGCMRCVCLLHVQQPHGQLFAL